MRLMACFFFALGLFVLIATIDEYSGAFNILEIAILGFAGTVTYLSAAFICDYAPFRRIGKLTLN